MTPEIRASRPTTIFFLPDCFKAQLPKAEVNFTMSKGVNPSPAAPPMVPRIPEIDFIKVNVLNYLRAKLKIFDR
jgi:hypothetical protein